MSSNVIYIYIKGMTATGLPAHPIILGKFEELIEVVKLMKSALDDQAKQLRDTLPAEVASTTVESINSSLTINGAVPVTKSDIAGIKSYLDTKLSDLEKSMADRDRTLSSRSGSSSSSSSSVQGMPPNQYGTWDWSDGQVFHHVPPGFRFPGNVSLFCIGGYGFLATPIVRYGFIDKFVGNMT